MAHISIESKGSFQNTEKFLRVMSKGDIFNALDAYAVRGTEALRQATPTRSGITAASWFHKVHKKGKYYSIAWYNSHVPSGIPVVILIQYGHGTKNGGFVQGRDFINPVIMPLFNQISEDVWKAVKNA